MLQIAFIGLGVMGYPMAGHLQRSCHQVTVYNRTASKAAQWVAEFGGCSAPTPAQASLNANIAITCVGNDDDVRSVVLGDEGILATLQPGGHLVDHTTSSAELARTLHATCTQQGIGFLDAPVSGGQQGALNAQLTIMCGGDEPTFAKVLPVLQCYAKQVKLMGVAGSGQLTKMVNQITICGLLQSLSEGLLFAEKVGLDQQSVIDVISRGAAQSWQMENRHKTMIAGEYEHGFAVDWMRKDLSIVLNEARSQGVSLPVAALVDQFFQDVQNLGGGRWDTSALLARLKALSSR